MRWIFSGSSTTSRSASPIRTSGNSHSQDTWRVNGNVFNANAPDFAGEQVYLSPLLSSSNTKDTASARARIPGGGRTNITFGANATNTSTITSGSRTIANFWIADNSNEDRLGIRVSGSSLPYSNGASSAWVGAGIINKPIGNFHVGTFNRARAFSTFEAASTGSIRLVVNNQIITEPEEYALIFALFALGFVLVRRHFVGLVWRCGFSGVCCELRKQQGTTTS